ncbi:LOW QUALITY PROTEIN: probable ubiquitin-conjugating enzyme E2 C [Hibiscus syriacus]|uniref:LOW QUALITY PROTEIN: probable ubiquitin-conjugating enzyme E2 C n=1 Tax=Hibiscus syriacus TaxID=106335 RepID=UPI0019219487|nr:LOW QUALITY PROTEIN: probable ubiquitin-conjugating enzyme E2 C [Hibiscus syriacus]
MEGRPNQTVDNSSTSPQQHWLHAATAAYEQPVSAINAVDATSATQRLQKELMDLMMCGGDLGVSAFPQGESIFTWIGTIEGGKGTMYEGLSYKVSLHFMSDYPFKPPQVKFETICFHPNVDQFGNICLDILQDQFHFDKWSSAYDCRTILLSVQSLLGDPNPESSLNNYAAALWNNKEDYRKMVRARYFGGKHSRANTQNPFFDSISDRHVCFMMEFSDEPSM